MLATRIQFLILKKLLVEFEKKLRLICNSIELDNIQRMLKLPSNWQIQWSEIGLS